MNRQDLIDEVNSFRDISENWDGYDGIPPTEPVIENCLKIIPIIMDEIKVFDDIYPNQNGTISIEFKTEKGNILLEIGNKSMGYYVEVEGKCVEIRDELYLISDNSFLTSTRLLNQDLKLII